MRLSCIVLDCGLCVSGQIKVECIEGEIYDFDQIFYSPLALLALLDIIVNSKKERQLIALRTVLYLR